MKMIKVNDITVNDEYTKNENTNVEGIENRLFMLCLTVLKVIGFWKSTTYKTPLNYFHNIYTLFSFMSIIILVVTIIIDNALTEKSIRAFIENLYLILTISNAVSKIINIILRRQRVIRLLEKIVQDRWSVLRDDEEVKIVEESVGGERFISRFCLYMVSINNVSNAINPLIHPDPDHDLMVDAYSPCNRSHLTCFWISYNFQVLGYVNTSLVHVGCDCLIFNLIERICAHIRILDHRILRLGDFVGEQEIRYLKERIKDHHNICETVKELNDIFYETVFIQFMSSIAVLCTNIYLLSIQDLFSAEFIGVFIYLCCALGQNFWYCWYGNKVSLNSIRMSNSIFDMDWYVLQHETKKMLTFIMLKSSQKIYLFNNAVVNLTPESFVNIVKLSYSAFNILTQTSKKDTRSM